MKVYPFPINPNNGCKIEALPGVLGNRGIMSFFHVNHLLHMSFISREHKSKNEGNRGTKVILGSRKIEN